MRWSVCMCVSVLAHSCVWRCVHVLQVDVLVAGARRADDALRQILPLLAQLNHMLPEDQRLEPFSPPMPVSAS